MVQVEGGTVPEEPPGPPVPACRTPRCYCSQGVGMGPLWMLTAPLGRSTIGHSVVHFPSFMCFQWSHTRISKSTDFPLLLSSPCKHPRTDALSSPFKNDTVVHGLWGCSSVSSDRWTEDDKMALLQTSLSLLLVGQAI